jgi:hypothetical protein
MTQSIDPQEWDPFTVWRTTVVDLQTVRWSLSEAPDPDWIAAFRSAPTKKSGSTEYVTSGSEPTISGPDIEWKVGPQDHLDANLRVHDKVDVANGAYRELLRGRAAERHQMAEEKRVRDAAIEEAQRKLDEANGVAG